MPILLDKPSLTVGNDRMCDVVIEHPSVSANHCHMEFRDGHWFIEDLGNGSITVNGEKVESAWLPALSVINIGAIEFDLQYSANGSATSAHDSVSSAMLTKLDRALKSAESFKHSRTQIQANQPAPAWIPKSRFGMLVPLDGESPMPLLYDELYLGRDRDCDVILPYLSIASTHCVLRFQEGYWSVRDLNNNGVTIDGKTAHEGWLLPGAVLGLGTRQYEMEYSTTASAPPPEMAVPINEFDVGDDESRPDADSDVFDVDESALVDSDDELEVVDPSSIKHDNLLNTDNGTKSDVKTPKSTPQDAAASVLKPPLATPSLPPILDEPLLAIDEMLHSIEENASRAENQDLVITESRTVEPPESNVAEPPTTTTPTPSKSVPVPKTNREPTVQKTTASSLPRPSSARRHEDTVPSPDFVASRRDQVLQFLKDRNFDGLLLTQPTNIAWYTGGTEPPRGLLGQNVAALLLTPESATLLARRSDVEVMLGSASSLAGLQHHACDWPQESHDILKDWSPSKRLACDRSLDLTDDVSSEISTLRLPLSAFELETLRKLGIRIARAIESAARQFQRGDTEAQIAGDVASRLVRHEVLPVRIQVWGDGRGQGFPNWTFRRDAVEQFCTISVIARRQGLHVAVSRTVSFGAPPKELRWTHSDMLLTHAMAMHTARDQAEVSTVLARVKTTCEKLGYVPDWQGTLPGCVTGYESCEAPLTSDSSLCLKAGMPVIWQSSLGPARAVDTLLVRKTDSKVLTQTGEWPLVSMTIQGKRYLGQTVLQRAT